MVELNTLLNWCNNTLNVNAFKDYCPNGLQVEGHHQVDKILTAVTASADAIDAAIAYQAQVLLVHHGYFWKGEAPVLTHLKGSRIKKLNQHNISLVAYHLPLDAHAELGNNKALADLLDIHITAPLDPSEAIAIGHVGKLAHAMHANELKQLLKDKLKQSVIYLNGNQRPIQTIGFCTGAAQDYLYKAAQQGCDAYISGEVSERTFYEARELGIHYFACGHHATERGGIQRLGDALAQQFNIAVQFYDSHNPI